MNLFIVGFNLPKEYRERIQNKILKMIKIYPFLDIDTIWNRTSKCNIVTSASMQSNKNICVPRQYLIENETEALLYCGLPINGRNTFSAHRSDELLKNWGSLLEDLEGMFCIVRIIYHPIPKVEVITDLLGMEHVFYYHEKDFWLLSNSARLIEEVSKKSSLDMVGASLFLSAGAVDDNRSLRKEIKLIPGGEHWILETGKNELKKVKYYCPGNLAKIKHKKFQKRDFQVLSEDLIETMQGLRNSFSHLTCAITGGRDTRMLASLVLRAGLPVKYYTFGEFSGTDARIASKIAKAIGIPYQFIEIGATEVINQWEALSEQIVRQTDGMGNINEIPSILANHVLCKEKRIVDLGGSGGQIAKGFYSTKSLKLYLNDFSLDSMKDYLGRRVISDHGGLINREGVKVARDYVHRFVNEYSDYGFSPADIPDVFMIFSRIRRRRGINKRALVGYQDFFTPFICRKFLEATFAFSPYQRCLQPIHYNLIQLNCFELHSIPFDKGSWINQNLFYNLLQDIANTICRKGPFCKKKYNNGALQKNNKFGKEHMATDMFDQKKWFQAKRREVREMCLDKKNSPIWGIVNRSAFEKITDTHTNPEELKSFGFYITQFYRIATLFYYEKSLEEPF
jgi:asparagine synthase (glutamine-hydrolysing)